MASIDTKDIEEGTIEWRLRLRRAIFRWFRRNARALPWRAGSDPYAVWVSEVILQQTRVATGTAYYERFLARFPTLAALAAAEEVEVLGVWSGLGYYARARNLHQAAREAVRSHGGALPDREDELRRLPGIGAYTAGAILSIAFGKPVPAVDGNVARILSRLLARNGGREAFRAEAAALVPRRAPGDWNQALMDLGAVVCLPRAPRCERCPVSGLCAANRKSAVGRYPAKTKKRPIREVRLVWGLVRRGRKVLLVRRPSSRGLYAGLYELPGGEVGKGETPTVALRRHLGARFGKSSRTGRFEAAYTQRLTHRHLRVEVYQAEAPEPLPGSGEWVDPDRHEDLACSGLVRRVLGAVSACSSGRSRGSPSA